MDKRGLMNLQQKLLSFIIGIVIVVLGSLTFIGGFYDISFLPDFIFSDLFLKFILVLGGGFLFYDSLKIGHGLSRLISLLAGLLVLLIGLIPIALHFKLLSFLPFFATLSIPSGVLKGIVIFFGAYLIVDSFIMRAKEQG